MRRYSFSIGFWAACLGWLLDGFDFTIFLLVMPAIAKEFGVSVTTTSVSITLTLLVRLLGGLFAGMAADRWGRKLPLMISIVWFALCDGAVAFAPSFQAVLILRTLFGFGMGAEWASGSTLAMESIPERSRGLGSGILQGSWAVGYLIAGVVYTWVSWRTLFLLAALPALLVIPIRFWVKESPRARQARFVPLMHALQDGLWKRVLSASLLLGAAVAASYAMTALSPTMLQT
ncbi:MAG: MFS transporter, partial [Myxococcaceae bacterium]